MGFGGAPSGRRGGGWGAATERRSRRAREGEEHSASWTEDSWPQPGSLAGCWNRAASGWFALVGSPAVRSWIAHGAGLRATASGVREAARRAAATPERRSSAEAEALVQAEVRKLVESGAAEPCGPEDVDLASPVFVVPKTTGGWRLVHDLRTLNEATPPPPAFHLPSPATLRDIARPGDWAATLDLKSGYHQLAVRAADRRLLGFKSGGQLFRFRVLPFGHSWAPYIFQRCTEAVAGVLRRRGVRCLVYLDDFLLLGGSEREAREAVRLTLRLMGRLGMRVSPDKSALTPAQVVEWLGTRIDLLGGTLSIPAGKRKSIAAAVGRTLARVRRGVPVAPRELAAAVGMLTATRHAGPQVSLFLGPLHGALRGVASRSDWKQRRVFAPSLARPLAAALSFVLRSDPAPLWPDLGRRQVTLFCDASDDGWGAVLTTTGPAEAQPTAVRRGRWSDGECSLHITAKEALAVARALQQLRPQVAGAAVHLRTDASAALGLFSRWSTSSTDLARCGWAAARALRRAKATLASVVYVPSSENPADAPSRFADSAAAALITRERQRAQREARAARGDEELAATAWATIRRRWGTPSVDLFASSPATARVTRFYSRWGGRPEAVGADALASAAAWASERLAYAFPPVPLIARFLSLVFATGARCVVVVPRWTGAAWWPGAAAAARDSLFWPAGTRLFRPRGRASWLASSSGRALGPVVALLFGRPRGRPPDAAAGTGAGPLRV